MPGEHADGAVPPAPLRWATKGTTTNPPARQEDNRSITSPLPRPGAEHAQLIRVLARMGLVLLGSESAEGRRDDG